MSNSSRTDAKLVEWDMQDLEFRHKFRNLKEWANQLERELGAALKLTNINTEAQLLKERDFHVMQLAAISTASIQNTEKSKLDRITAENDYCSQAYLDVCAAIDREMARRNERDEALEVNKRANAMIGDIANECKKFEEECNVWKSVALTSKVLP